jgi:hypothetical protein
MTDITVYASIGNSDDKLSQKEWSEYFLVFNAAMSLIAEEIYGVWTSRTTDPYQNACVGIRMDDKYLAKIKTDLSEIAEDYKQDSIAFCIVEKTEMITPGRNYYG